MTGMRGIGSTGIEGLAGLGPIRGPSPAGEPGAGEAPSFASALGQAVGEVEKMQLAADGEAQKAAFGAGNLHETALALEKADVSMRVLTKVRNKVVEAYQEIMRMSV
jgi:flagellar hook-basal body complex protein FliE